ncbi:DciA family protein [Altererythrobacter sp. MTPC7]
MERDADETSGKGTKPSGKAAGARAKTPAKPRAKARPYERPRGRGAKAIGDLTPQVGRTAFRRFGFVQSNIVTRWPEIVGNAHAQVSSPEAIRFPPGERAEGILQLVVMPAHAPLIQHVIPEIIERVNRFFGYKAVARVKIRQGNVQAPRAGDKPKAPPSLKPIPMELGESLRDVGDPELRAVLEGLARSLGDGRKADQEQDR